MPVFAVIYHYDPAKHDLRMDKRPEHRAFLGSLEGDGILIAGGAWTDDTSAIRQPPWHGRSAALR